MTSQAEYLKRYLSGGDGDKAKGTKKVRKVAKPAAAAKVNNLAIHDDEVSWQELDSRTGSRRGADGDDDDFLQIEGESLTASELNEIKRKLRTEIDSPTHLFNVSVKGKSKNITDADLSPPRKSIPTRYDSPDKDLSPPRKSKPTRYDSPDADLSPPRKSKPTRYDSPDKDLSPPRKSKPTRYDSPDKDLSPPRKSSQHQKVGGLRVGDQFKEEMEEQNKLKRSSAIGSNPEAMGKDAPVVFRNRQGKRVDTSNYAGGESESSKPKWGQDAVREREKLAMKERIRQEKFKPLAVYADDEELNDQLKEKSRWDDPMKKYVDEIKKMESTLNPQAKPKYKGPYPPNRFNIPPGYRWDGIDRSNGYEAELFKKQTERKANEEAAYKWRSEEL